MAVVANPRDDDRDIVEWCTNPHDKQPYLIAEQSKGYKVYADAGYYSERSGGVTVKGKVQRDADNKIIRFRTLGDAIAWVTSGMQIVERGDTIEIKGRI